MKMHTDEYGNEDQQQLRDDLRAARMQYRRSLENKVLIFLFCAIVVLLPMAALRMLGAPAMQSIGKSLLGDVGHGAFTATWCALMRHVGWLAHDTSDYTAGLFLSSRIRNVLSWPICGSIWRFTSSYTARDYPYILHRSAWFDGVWSELETIPQAKLYQKGDAESIYDVVMIGSGYDTRPLRILPGANRQNYPWLRVWEVDHGPLLHHKASVLAVNDLEPHGCAPIFDLEITGDDKEALQHWTEFRMQKDEEHNIAGMEPASYQIDNEKLSRVNMRDERVQRCPSIRTPLPEVEHDENVHEILLENMRKRGFQANTTQSNSRLMIVLEGVSPFLSCKELSELLSAWHSPGAKIVWDIRRDIGNLCNDEPSDDAFSVPIFVLKVQSIARALMMPWADRPDDETDQYNFYDKEMARGERMGSKKFRDRELPNAPDYGVSRGSRSLA